MNGILKLLAFACCLVTAAAVCAVSKYNQGPRDWLRCSAVNFAEIQSKLGMNLVAISVSQSPIPELPNFGFIRNASTLENLNFHDCGISRIGNEAFRGLASLKKLSLSYNNITKLNISWFYDLSSLEQLDVSFNMISELDPNIYFQLSKLQRLDLSDNLLKCIPTPNAANMKQLRDIRIHENPLTYSCRAQLTLWLKDHKVVYATNEDNFVWLDSILWQCLIDLPEVILPNSKEDKKMNICVITKMFDQLTTVLGASPSIQTSTTECTTFRTSLTQCLQNQKITTNGDSLMNFLALAQDASKVGAPR